MIDLHAHILPGIDDGAQDMLDALELAEIAWENGTKALVVTPHSNQPGRFENYNTKEFRDIYFKFCRILEKERISLKVYPGMEIFVTKDISEKIEKKLFVGLNHSRYYLVEFSFEEEPDDIRKGLKNILALDFDDYRTRELPLHFRGKRFITLKLVSSDPEQIRRQTSLSSR